MRFDITSNTTDIYAMKNNKKRIRRTRSRGAELLVQVDDGHLVAGDVDLDVAPVDATGSVLHFGRLVRDRLHFGQSLTRNN